MRAKVAAMAGLLGTIIGLDRDGIGSIHLDDGRDIRFGMSSCVGIPVPAAGIRVCVLDVVPGFRGALKASKVLPAVEIAKPETPTWEAFSAAHPRWSDVVDVCLRPALSAPRLEAPPKLLAPWRDEIIATAPIIVGLSITDQIEPSASDSFSHGSMAFLDRPTWPACGLCAKPLEMCFQLAPELLVPWIADGSGLVAMFCFHCLAKPDRAKAYVRLLEPRHRVVSSDTTTTASSQVRRPSQRIRPQAPVRRVPSSMWYRYRSSIVVDTAASALFGFSAVEGFEDEIKELEDWLTEQPGASDRLGGAPAWDQDDATPSCAHDEMKQLVQYNGGQFLDGGLHVFYCQDCNDLDYVAEF